LNTLLVPTTVVSTLLSISTSLIIQPAITVVCLVVTCPFVRGLLVSRRGVTLESISSANTAHRLRPMRPPIPHRRSTLPAMAQRRKYRLLH
jgi:hypothetical protein